MGKYAQPALDEMSRELEAKTEEIGELIAFLLSDKAGFVVGETVGFTGGWP